DEELGQTFRERCLILVANLVAHVAAADGTTVNDVAGIGFLWRGVSLPHLAPRLAPRPMGADVPTLLHRGIDFGKLLIDTPTVLHSMGGGTTGGTLGRFTHRQGIGPRQFAAARRTDHELVIVPQPIDASPNLLVLPFVSAAAGDANSLVNGGL